MEILAGGWMKRREKEGKEKGREDPEGEMANCEREKSKVNARWWRASLKREPLLGVGARLAKITHASFFLGTWTLPASTNKCSNSLGCNGMTVHTTTLCSALLCLSPYLSTSISGNVTLHWQDEDVPFPRKGRANTGWDQAVYRGRRASGDMDGHGHPSSKASSF